jgi:hypothetical protein
MLKQQQNSQPAQIFSTNNRPKITLTGLKTAPLNINVSGMPPNSSLITLKTATPNPQIKLAPAPGTTSLKRPFIMMAVFFVFGLNILQFISLNQTPLMSANQIEGLVEGNDAHQLAAALASAQARDNALLDASMLAPRIVKARHLLSEFDDYDSGGEAATNKHERNSHKQKNNHQKANKTTAATATGNSNLTKRDNDGMELVLINGTWHLINLSMCYNILQTSSGQFHNHTHMARVNSELNGWVERHQSHSRFRDQSKTPQHAAASKYASSALLRNLNKNQRLSLSGDSTVNGGLKLDDSFRETKPVDRPTAVPVNKKVYPISLYDTQQNTRYENFAKTIRKRNDTFYFISFRRDYAILPALAQNKTQRPRISLLIPALLSNGNESSRQQQATVSFIRIECDVTDTSLFHLKLNDIPLDYMKIIHQDFVMNGGGSGGGGSGGGSNPTDF